MASAIAELRQQVRTLELSESEQWRQLTAMRDRLQPWVGWVFGVGGTIIGYLTHWLGVCLR